MTKYHLRNILSQLKNVFPELFGSLSSNVDVKLMQTSTNVAYMTFTCAFGATIAFPCKLSILHTRSFLAFVHLTMYSSGFFLIHVTLGSL